MMYRRNQGIMAADMNGETVMMNIMTGKYYNIGTVGGRIWELLGEPLSMAALVAKLIAEYEVSAEQCEKDIQPFLQEMMENGLILTGNK